MEAVKDCVCELADFLYQIDAYNNAAMESMGTVAQSDGKVKGLSFAGLDLEDLPAGAPSAAGNAAQAAEALVTLGYSPSEAAAAVGRLDSTLPAEELIRLALKGFGSM